MYVLLAPDTAKALSEKILKAVRSLEDLPERDPLCRGEPWHSQNVRFLRAKNDPVFYTADRNTDTVSVARILCGGRDISHQMEETMEW